jgi:hypothetical protein
MVSTLYVSALGSLGQPCHSDLVENVMRGILKNGDGLTLTCSGSDRWHCQWSCPLWWGSSPFPEDHCRKELQAYSWWSALSSEPRSHRSHSFSSLPPPTGWLTAGQNLKALRLVGILPDYFRSPVRIQGSICSHLSPMHLGRHPRLGGLLTLGIQIIRGGGRSVMQVGTCSAHRL